MKWIVAAIAACLVCIGIGIYYAVRPQAVPARQVPIVAAYEARVKNGYWARGAADPKVIVTEYGDFQCPACYAFEPILSAAMQQTASVSQLQFRDYPLTDKHDKAELAAIGAEAAGRQGQFWQMHDLLYVEQPQWDGESLSGFRAQLDTYASALKLNVSQFNQDLDDPTTLAPITQNLKQGDAAGIDGTPYLLINGKVIENLPTSSAAMVDLINSAAQ